MTTKFEELNKCVEKLGMKPMFCTGMPTDKFFQGIVDVVSSIPDYVEKKGRKAHQRAKPFRKMTNSRPSGKNNIPTV